MMNVRCFHCGRAVPITPEQLGGEAACPSCGRAVRLPQADVCESPCATVLPSTGGLWISNSISGLVSLVLHMGLLLIFAAVTCDYQGGEGTEGEEVLIGELPQLQLAEQSDEWLDAAESAVAPEAETLADTLEIIAPMPSGDGDFSLDIDPHPFVPSGGGAQIAALTGGGGAWGQGASFMGLHAQGTRFCIIADCSGSMAGPRLEFVKQEILETLSTMTGRSRFQLLFFHSRALPYPQSGWRDPRRDRDDVALWLQTVSAAGGTNPTPAFRQAFQLTPPPDAIFFMTDGLFEERVVQEVAELNRHSGRNVQIHTIAFMDTSSEPLMRQIANDSGGRYRHVSGF